VRLYLIRHGETEYNRQGLALGRRDVALNEEGQRQAERLGRVLAKEGLGAVYSSPLLRARDTATAVAAAHGLPVRVEERLVEMDVGEVDGLPFDEVERRYPDLLRTWMSEDGPTEPIPGGESLAQVLDRAWAWVDELNASVHPRDRIAAVTHNFVILSLLAQAVGLGLPNFRRFRHAVAAVSVLDFEDGRATLVRLNDTCHLDDD
jgi:broad specificity phosphatase PhoE